MEVKWTRSALRDIESLRAYIRLQNETAADAVAKRIQHIVLLISERPSLGRPGRVPNTREIAVTQTPFLIPYTVMRNHLIILRVLHGAQKWPAG